MQGLEKGINNLYKHIDNIRNKFGLNVLVAINKYNNDSNQELEYISNKLAEINVPLVWLHRMQMEVMELLI